MSAVSLDAFAPYAPLCLIGAPSLGALLALALPWGRMAAIAGLTSLALSAALATTMLAASVFPGGAVIEAVGPIQADAWALTAVAASHLGALVVACGGFAGLSAAVDRRVVPLGVALAMAALAGWTAAAFAGDLVTLFVALHLSALSMAALAALAGGSQPGALVAALRLAGGLGLGGALIAFGAALLLAGLGHADLAALRSAAGGADRAVAAAIALSLAGVGFGAMIAPLHHWAPAALSRAPLIVGGLLLAAGAPVCLSIMARLAGVLSDLGAAAAAGAGLVAAGSASVLIGSVQALASRDLRRLAGYAFAAKAGCALLCLGLGTPEGAAAAALVVFAAGGACLLLAVCGGEEGGLASLDGLAKRSPAQAAATTLGALSLIGAPLTLGFAGTWVALEALLARGWWGAAGLVVAASLAAVGVGGRLLERVYLRSPVGGGVERRRHRLRAVGLWALVLVSAAGGLASSPLSRAAERAGAALVAPAGDP